MSIVRIGLSETKHFAEGYDAIFGKKSAGKGKKEASATSNKSKKKPGKKKK